LAYDRKQGGHKVAQADRPDYRVEVGRAEVQVGVTRGFSVLDPAQAATLDAWVATLIPAGHGRPDAAEVGAAEYVDATVELVPALQPLLTHAIARLDAIATSKAHKAFAQYDVDERERLLRELEAEDDTDAFNMVRDWTYEAYYGHPAVLAVLEAGSGWSATTPTRGSDMKPFDASRLARIGKLPPRWRKA
jgi:hypothetical protein